MEIKQDEETKEEQKEETKVTENTIKENSSTENTVESTEENTVESTNKSFLAKLRGGEYPLVTTFWLCGVLAVVLWAVLYAILLRVGNYYADMGQYKAVIFLAIIYSFFNLLYHFNLLVGLWRSATNFKGWNGWIYITKTIVCIWWIFFFLGIVNFIQLCNTFGKFM